MGNVVASVAGRELKCWVCDGNQFSERSIKLNTTGAELFGIEWANKSAVGLICTDCGYVHEFVGDVVQLSAA
jgi:predicted nucleic-acid-binding Zn-ribbon protein